VTIDRADIVEAQFLEKRSAGQHAACVFFGALCAFLDKLGRSLGNLFADFAERPIGIAGCQA
jgi:hypothetical protein